MKQRRLEECIDVFRDEAARVNGALVGSTQLVLVEGVSTAPVTNTWLSMDTNSEGVFMCQGFYPVTRQHCSSQISIFVQESKRSAEDLCGRTDGNMKVIFPKEDVAVQPAESSTAPIRAGDYVLVKVSFGLLSVSQAL